MNRKIAERLKNLLEIKGYLVKIRLINSAPPRYKLMYKLSEKDAERTITGQTKISDLDCLDS